MAHPGFEITALGLCTAQGSAADIASGKPLRAPGPLPFEAPPRAVARICRTASGAAPALRGHARWNALSRAALQECMDSSAAAPADELIVASCNGGADSLDELSWRQAFDTSRLLSGTAWADAGLPVISASCASGLHALWLACARIVDGADAVVVLAADIVSPASQANFESLRVLSAGLETPFASDASGFIAGEAAIALRVQRAGSGGVALSPPALATDLAGFDGLAAALRSAAGHHPPARHALCLGTGPAAANRRELAALPSPGHMTLATAGYAFGHTLGCSGLLGVALAYLTAKRAGPLPALAPPAEHTPHGHPMQAPSQADCLVSCRALGGACAAVRVGVAGQDASHAPCRGRFHTPDPPAALSIPVLRALAREAAAARPSAPPRALIVVLDAPLTPPARARIGQGLLPSAVLEITPGQVGMIVARCWGYGGPVFTVVGGPHPALLSSVRRQGAASMLYLTGQGECLRAKWRS